LGTEALQTRHARAVACALALCLIIGLAPTARAQITTDWFGGADTNWSNGGNWTSSTPSAADTANLTGVAAPNQPSLTASSAVNILNQSGNTLTLGGFTLTATTVNLSGGTITGTGALSLGTLNFSGGTIDNTVNIVLTGGGVVAVSNTSGNLDLSNITGSGSLTKDGAGQLTLGGTNTYDGSTTINAGTVLLSVATNTLPATTALIVNGGTLKLNGTAQTVASLAGTGGTIDMATFGLTVDGSASTSYGGIITSSGGDLTKAGSGTLTLTGANTYTGGTDLDAGAIAVGNNSALGSGPLNMAAGTTLQAASGVSLGNAIVLAGSDTVDTNGNAMTLSGVISGAGSLTKIGSGTLTLSGTNIYAGGTTVSAGTLALTGSIAGNATVNTGATLSGTGTVGGGLTVSGTIAPGSGSFGTLSVGGAYTQNAGSTYTVKVNAAGANDRISVTGGATLGGGTVSVLAASGTYGRSTTYTILSATGGVAGTYSGVTSNLAFLTPSLSYSANAVMLTLLSTGNSFQNGAQTPNQRAVGTVLDQASPSATGDFANVLNALFNLDTVQGPRVLQALSGQNYSAFSSLAVQGTQLFMDAFPFGGGTDSDDGNSAALFGGRPAYLALKSEDCPPDATACDIPSVWGVWGGALGGFGTVAGDANASGVTYNLGGFVAGLDRRFAPDFKAGIAAGFNAASLYTVGQPGYGTSNTLQFALYGELKEGPFYLDALAGYGHSDNRMTRPLVIPGLPYRAAQGYTTANTLFGELEGGYKIVVAPSFGGFVTPFARLQASTSTQNGFSESGADSLNLNVAAITTNSLRSVLGGQLGAGIDAPWREKLKVVLRLGWSHEFADLSRPVTASFAGAPALGFTTFGASAPRDGIVLGLGANTTVAEHTRVYFRYDGDLAGANTNHVLSAGVRYVW
jgi:outer membrane autotransporter protein